MFGPRTLLVVEAAGYARPRARVLCGVDVVTSRRLDGMVSI